MRKLQQTDTGWIRKPERGGLLRMLEEGIVMRDWIKWWNTRTANQRWFDHTYILGNVEACTEETYEKMRHVQEAEHQIGRFLNMKKIAKEIVEKNYTGDVVEFGVWRGVSMVLLQKAFAAAGSQKRKFVGIDTFEGLPETSTVWVKGTFNNTSQAIAGLLLSSHNMDYTLVKGLFAEPHVADEIMAAAQDVVLFHFDADLGSSTRDALHIATPYLTDRHPAFFLFDDWGCSPDEVPEAFYAWLKEHPEVVAEKLYTTRFTRYYRIRKVGR